MVLERSISPRMQRTAPSSSSASTTSRLVETQAIAHDETQLIQSTQQAAQELLELFEADRDQRKDAEATAR